MTLKVSDFDYELPAGLIAQEPASGRGRSRLMVLHRGSGRIAHHVFADLPCFLEPGDVLVLNDTRVIPARFECRRRTGGRIEGLFLREISPGRWEVMLRGAGRCRRGEALDLVGDASVRVTLEENLSGGTWRVRVRPPARAVEVLERVGRTPLPPYIRRPAEGDDGRDRRAYQTVYARRPGAVAAPTAGLHFTRGMLRRLRRNGVENGSFTLHVGVGTFAPVRVERLADHRMHAEWYEVSAAAAEVLASARRRKRRIVAVGTTSVRVLETVAALGGASERSGWTDLFIYPPWRFRAVDAMLTNFHLPRSTLLMLVAAFCTPGRTEGVEVVREAYRQAIREGYRFYSYGDAMLVL